MIASIDARLADKLSVRACMYRYLYLLVGGWPNEEVQLRSFIYLCKWKISNVRASKSCKENSRTPKTKSIFGLLPIRNKNWKSSTSTPILPHFHTLPTTYAHPP